MRQLEVSFINIKIVERDKVDTPNTQIHDPSPSWVGTGTSVKSDGLSEFYELKFN
jgi:hypothetical protein